jgi:transposase
MTQSPQPVQSTEGGGVLYMALELSAKEWLLAFGVGVATPVRRRRMPAGAVEVLRDEVAGARERFGLAADAPVRSCYEAGRDGFWVHRLLTQEGITNLVVDSSSIEVSRRARRAKTDRLDAEHLLRLLCRAWGGERQVWHVVHVPSPALEDTRQVERWVATLVQERTRWRNRIRGLLALQGVRVALTPAGLAALATSRTGDGAPLPPHWLARVHASWRQWQDVEAQLRTARRAQRARLRAAAAAARTTPLAARTPEMLAAQLHGLRGVGIRTALPIAKEVLGRDLRNRRQVGALSGFVPMPYQSGTRAHEQGISRAGLRRMRGVLVELAWQWVRYQPTSALTRWYQARFGAGGRRPRKVGIVAVARRLLIALWRYVQTGALPDGAELRARA